jgi:hypothetical protein
MRGLQFGFLECVQSVGAGKLSLQGHWNFADALAIEHPIHGTQPGHRRPWDSTCHETHSPQICSIYTDILTIQHHPSRMRSVHRQPRHSTCHKTLSPQICSIRTDALEIQHRAYRVHLGHRQPRHPSRHETLSPQLRSVTDVFCLSNTPASSPCCSDATERPLRVVNLPGHYFLLFAHLSQHKLFISGLRGRSFASSGFACLCAE